MIAVRITGGLGNQMFQYAFARALRAQQKEVVLHWHGQRRWEQHNGWELDEVFDRPLSANIRTANSSPLLNARAWFMRKTARRRQSSDIGYDPSFLEVETGYLDGYWQTEMYFKSIENTLRDDFRFKPLAGQKNIKLAERIASGSCTSVHVRRGDYLKIPGLGEVCTPDYYRNALGKLEEIDPGTTLIVFSDDIPFCQDLFPGNKAVFVDWNRGSDSWMDMALMSRCRHHIIANSSFSWWGAWLDASPDKMVIAPVKWFSEDAPVTNPDIYPDPWIRV